MCWPRPCTSANPADLRAFTDRLAAPRSSKTQQRGWQAARPIAATTARGADAGPAQARPGHKAARKRDGDPGRNQRDGADAAGPRGPAARAAMRRAASRAGAQRRAGGDNARYVKMPRGAPCIGAPRQAFYIMRHYRTRAQRRGQRPSATAAGGRRRPARASRASGDAAGRGTTPAGKTTTGQARPAGTTQPRRWRANMRARAEGRAGRAIAYFVPASAERAAVGARAGRRAELSMIAKMAGAALTNRRAAHSAQAFRGGRIRNIAREAKTSNNVPARHL